PARDFQEAINQFASRRFTRRNPVDIGIARIAFVMINIDEQLSARDAFAGRAKPFEARAIGGDDTIKFLSAFWFLKQLAWIEEGVFLRHFILVPTGDLFALALQRERQSQLGTNAISIGPDVADDADRPALADRLNNAINNLRVRLHD